MLTPIEFETRHQHMALSTTTALRVPIELREEISRLANQRGSTILVLSPDAGNGLTAETAFQVEQVRAVSTDRLTERLGRIDTLSRHAIDETLRYALCL